MAISSGKTTNNSQNSFTRYIGVAPCEVLAINPNAAKTKELFNYEPENEPSYFGQDDKGNLTARVTFVVKPVLKDASGNQYPPMTVTFFLTKAPLISQAGKCKVIDKYGRTAWVTQDEYKAKAIPMYSNGPAKLDKDYKPCYYGQDELTKFIISYLGIAPIDVWNNNTRKFEENPNKADCYCSLDNIENYFKGDFKEVIDAIAMQPKNAVDICFGVRKDMEGRMFQTFLKSAFCRGFSKSHKNIEREITQGIERGAFFNTEYSAGDFMPYQYKVKETEFKQQGAGEQIDIDFGTPTVTEPQQTIQEDELPF
jgi:hypothetical protein